MQIDIAKVLNFWFEGYPHSRLPQSEQIQRWFKSDPAFDDAIRSELGELHTQATTGNLENWESTPEGSLALLILLDQCSRNLFRGSGQAFAWDAQALALAKALCASGGDQALPALSRLFVYLPFNTARPLKTRIWPSAFYENCKPQPAGLEAAMASFVDYAFQHREVIARFGRSPPQCTPESLLHPRRIRFLSQPGSSFG